MNSSRGIIIKLLLLQCLFLLCVSQSHDFFYFTQEWGPSYCSSTTCCYPVTGKPATNFTIAGLYPSLSNGTWLGYCNKADFCAETITNLKKGLQKSWPTLACPTNDGTNFWEPVWTTYGVCSLTKLSQYQYFQAALRLHGKVNLLQALEDAGIYPGGSYKVSAVKEAIKIGTGYDAAIQCNKDKNGNDQIYKVFLCADSYGKDLIECPTLPKRICSAIVNFPTYEDAETQLIVSQVTNVN